MQGPLHNITGVIRLLQAGHPVHICLIMPLTEQQRLDWQWVFSGLIEQPVSIIAHPTEPPGNYIVEVERQMQA